MLEVTDKEIPISGNPNPSPNFANVVHPSMATFTLPRFMISLPVWLFSTSLIPNTQTIPPQVIFSPQPSSPSQHQPHVDSLPSSPNMSSSLSSSSSLGKRLDATNQVTKKKKKKQDKKEVDQPTMVVGIGNVEETSNMHHKPRCPCKLCKGDHFLIGCRGIPKVLEVWSKNSYQLIVDPSTSDCEVPKKKGKVRFPCRLCK